MKNTYFISLIFLIFLLSSCDPLTYVENSFYNNSEQDVQILFYTNDSLANLLVVPSKKKEIFLAYCDMKGSGFPYLNNYDSIHILFEDETKIKYKKTEIENTIYDATNPLIWLERIKNKRDDYSNTNCVAERAFFYLYTIEKNDLNE
jgi:hypothetical protein